MDVAVASRYEGRVPLRAVATEENKLRLAALEPPLEIERLVSPWRRLLELWLVYTSLHDAILRLGLLTIGDLQREAARVDELVKTLSRLEPRRVVDENAALLTAVASAPPNPQDPATLSTETVLLATQSLLLNCPIQSIEETARRVHRLAEETHGCRVAYDGLAAFVARHERPEQLALATAERMIREGRATVDELAAMLGRDVPDVVALLEEGGYRRSIDQIRLSPEERAARLKAMREDRLARNGAPASNERDIARDVIASQRIEGVDARPWLRS